jgi:hypothetical protein
MNEKRDRPGIAALLSNQKLCGAAAKSRAYVRSASGRSGTLRT